MSTGYGEWDNQECWDGLAAEWFDEGFHFLHLSTNRLTQTGTDHGVSLLYLARIRASHFSSACSRVTHLRLVLVTVTCWSEEGQALMSRMPSG